MRAIARPAGQPEQADREIDFAEPNGRSRSGNGAFDGALGSFGVFRADQHVSRLSPFLKAFDGLRKIFLADVFVTEAAADSKCQAKNASIP
jgi:hypothetical protein